MEHFSTQDLEALVAGVQSEHYCVSTAPVMAVVFQEAVKAMSREEGAIDFKVLQDITAAGIIS